MSDALDYCWIGSDGSLQSGSLTDLLGSAANGTLPSSHPVWRQGWAEWVPLAEARLLLESLLEPEPTTSREPPRFDDAAPERHSQLLDVWSSNAPCVDADPTLEDLTLPRAPSLLPPVEARRAHAAPPLPPPTPQQRVAHPAPRPQQQSTSSEAPPGVSHTLRPPAERAHHGPPVLAALAGGALAFGGAAIALGIVASGWTPEPARPLARALPSTTSRIETIAHRSSHPLSTQLSCRGVGRATVLHEHVELGSAVHTARGNGLVAVGVSTTARTGVGLLVPDGGTDKTRTRQLFDPVHLAGVVPVTTGGDVQFVADRWARTLPASTSMRVGMTPGGFSAIAEDGSSRTVWSGQAAQVISRPSVVAVPGRGFALAFRRGGETANVRFGWMHQDGSRWTELSVLSVASGLMEPPSLATQDDRVAIAYSVRQPASAPWSIELGQTTAGRPFASTAALKLPGRVLDRRAPSIAPLADGGWVLAWAEGDRDSGRSVRAQELDRSLHPVGAPVTLSTLERSVGTIAVAPTPDGALILFTERNGRSLQRLWAVALDCR